MARYIALIRFTEQGSRNIGKSASRAAAFRKAAERAGVTVEAQYWTAGSCDGVIILNGDDMKVFGSLAQLASMGNVRTETLRAFDAGQFKAIAR